VLFGIRVDLDQFQSFKPSAKLRPTAPALFLRRWKPTLVLGQAAQVFDLAGVAGRIYRLPSLI
jgi:hypothetical protein